jgi:hypothetical protein
MTAAEMLTRADGWPLCPVCAQDELYCVAAPACVCAEMACYRCSWRGDPRTAQYPELLLEIGAWNRWLALFRNVPGDSFRPAGMGRG